jgi:hypothetical protein
VWLRDSSWCDLTFEVVTVSFVKVCGVVRRGMMGRMDGSVYLGNVK